MDLKRLKIYTWILLALGLTLTTNVFWFQLLDYNTLPLYDLRRLIELATLTGLTLLGIAIPSINTTIQHLCKQLPKWVYYVVGVIFIIGIISSLTAPFPRFALLEIATYALLIFTSFVVASLVQLWGKNHWQWPLSLIGVSLLALCITHYSVIGHWLYNVIQVVQMGFHVNLSAKDIEHITLYPAFTNIRFLTQAISWTWPLLILPLLADHSNRKRYLIWAIPFFILASFWWSLAFGKLSRALILEWILVTLLILPIFKQTGLKWLKWQILAALLGFTLFTLYHDYLIPHYLNQLTSQTNAADAYHVNDDFSAHKRLFFYHAAWLMAWHHPFFGVGPMHYALHGAHLPYDQVSFIDKDDLVAHPHNAWLYIAANWGLVVLTLVIALFAKAVYSMIRHCWIEKSHNTQNITKLCVSASLAAGIVHACFSGIIIMPLSQLLLVIISGWCLGLYLPAIKQLDHIAILPWIISIMIMLIALGLLVYGIAPMWDQWNYNMLNYVNQTGIHKVAPNYWGQGFIEYWP